MKPVAAAAAALAVAACSPTLNWREVRSEGALALFPCKPALQARELPLAGTTVRMSLQSCRAGDATWALASADLGDPALVGAALEELLSSARRNLEARPVASQALSVPGMTPASAALRARLEGRRPDGTPVHAEVAVFARGTRVYQAMIVGAPKEGEAVPTFFAALRLAP